MTEILMVHLLCQVSLSHPILLGSFTACLQRSVHDVGCFACLSVCVCVCVCVFGWVCISVN